MKHTIAENKQLFNVTEIADAVTYDALAEGQFGIFPIDSDTSLPAAAAFADLPEEFRFVSKRDGKVYYSFDTIKKSEIRHFQSEAYKAPEVNIWKATIEHCDCIKTALVRIGIEEDSLIRRDGLSWADTDNAVVSAPKELSCVCDCTGKPVYDNHLMTKAIWQKLNDTDSPFYLAKIETEAGVELADLAAIDAFIAANKVVNTDDDETNDSEKLVLVIEGKPAATRDYKDLDVNYIFPRGAKLFPAITLNDEATCIEFEETQEIGYELGAGADLRAAEFECMSLYTNLNFYPQLHDGIASGELVYQFENRKQYNTVDFEFYTEKVNRNDGDKRSFGVCLASEDPAVFAVLEALFQA